MMCFTYKINATKPRLGCNIVRYLATFENLVVVIATAATGNTTTTFKESVLVDSLSVSDH